MTVPVTDDTATARDLAVRAVGVGKIFPTKTGT